MVFKSDVIMHEFDALTRSWSNLFSTWLYWWDFFKYINN